jgi:hypothetical protein
VNAATKLKDKKDETIPHDHNLGQERPNAGPTINQCPVLQVIFAKLEASDEEWSSDSDIEKGKKRKIVVMDAEGLDKGIIMERFGLQGMQGMHKFPAD